MINRNDFNNWFGDGHEKETLLDKDSHISFAMFCLSSQWKPYPENKPDDVAVCVFKGNGFMYYGHYSDQGFFEVGKLRFVKGVTHYFEIPKPPIELCGE